MATVESLEALVIRRTLRVPDPGPSGSGKTNPSLARLTDTALLSEGFKASRSLLDRMRLMPVEQAREWSQIILGTVQKMVGSHAQHNSYFIDFPKNIPDTQAFWMKCFLKAVRAGALADGVKVAGATGSEFKGNLLSLPDYGTYPHTYVELLAVQDELVASAKDQLKLLQLGQSVLEEAADIFQSLGASVIPLAEEDLRDLQRLARELPEVDPWKIPVRENWATISAERIKAGYPSPPASTVTDILRVACVLSDGDVSLQETTRFVSFPRARRRLLMESLDVVAASEGKLGDVAQYAEQWKRLGERIKPHEYPALVNAQRVFATARREEKHPSFTGKVEVAFKTGAPEQAASILRAAPGMLFRNLDRMLRVDVPVAERDSIIRSAQEVAPQVSGRVLLSVREHLQNRTADQSSRIFANRKGTAFVIPKSLPPLDTSAVSDMLSVIDTEVSSRLPKIENLVVDPAILDVALPLSGKAVSPGIGVLPRGSISEPLDTEWVRVFAHWQQAAIRTDYDLSASFLHPDFWSAGHVSWTNLSTGYAEYSGDIVDAPAPQGATEFINFRIRDVPHPYIVPQLLIYSGEQFDEAAEAFFGYMQRDEAQDGRPFEARTVRMKSDLRGSGRISLPFILMRGTDDTWRIKWTHLYLKGNPSFNIVEGDSARLTTSMLIRSIVEREYITVRYLIQLMERNGAQVGYAVPDDGSSFVYIGIQAPEKMPDGSGHITPANLGEIIPE